MPCRGCPSYLLPYNRRMDCTLTHLGAMSVSRFMREHWQRRPLLVRNALTPPAVDRRQLFALAARDEVESRLIVRRGQDWTLRHGPIPRRALPPLRQKHWTLLVQGLDGLDQAAHRFLARFRFVPDARLDDLMASYASDGGGVGPHVDNYDVFLVQAAGFRRWRIGRARDPRLQPGRPLRLLAHFQPEQEWLLGPGDLLYLPPGIAHDGIAVGESITLSVGYRTPTFQELLDPWFADFASRNELPGRYADPGLRPTTRPGALPPAMVARVHAALSRHRPRRADTERFLLEYLSEPKDHIVFRRPPRIPAPAAFARAARRRGVLLDPRSRLLTGRTGVGINGEFVPAAPGGVPASLRQLADRRRLDGRQLAAAPAACLTLLRDWLQAGWLTLGPGR